MTVRLPPRFLSEKELVTGLVNFIRKTKDESYELLREFEGGFGRPDLLLFSTPERNSIRDLSDLATLNPRFAPLLSKAASKRIQTLRSLALVSGVSLASAKRIAKELAGLGRAEMSAPPRESLKISPIQSAPFRQVVAVEAKLRDWRRALIQAYRYLQYSNESWVVLDHAHATSAVKNQASFSSCGVGLASMSSVGELYVHVFATNRKWEDSALAWRAQALLARLIAKN